MDTAPQYHGSLVAFEGPQEIISTQLRLLPNSPNILIIPPLRYFLREEDPDSEFDAQSHILTIHNACAERAEMARAFLQCSTSNNKRLVFMNGGTAGAQMECIINISKHLTNEDFDEAERIFNGLAKHGISGLRRRHKGGANPRLSLIPAAEKLPSEQGEQVANDPASEAMRAADALDLETASLQPSNEVDLTTATRSRSTSVPVYRVADDFYSGAPFYVFGARKWQRNNRDPGLSQTPRRSQTTQESRMNVRQVLDPVEPQMNEHNSQPSFLNCAGEEDAKRKSLPASIDLASLRSWEFGSMPNTPSICEALVVDVRASASAASHKKTLSVDRIHSRAARNQDILLCSFPKPPRSRPQSMDKPLEGLQAKLPLRSKFAAEIPRATFSTPNRSVTRRAPPPPLRLQRSLRRPKSYVDHATSPISSYVDRGTSTEPGPASTTHEASTKNSGPLDVENIIEVDPDEPYEPILPMVENLVILFKTEKPNSRLEATVRAFRDGTYPISKPPPGTESEDISDRSSTLGSQEAEATPPDDKIYIQYGEVGLPCRRDSDEYDPFAYGKYLEPSGVWPPKQDVNSHRPSTPPTPAQTPPPIPGRPGKCFHNFTTTNCRTAVCVQNSLRSILNIYFPPEDAGYHQFNFPLLPELSSLWKPVFREADAGTVVQRKQKVDLILAIGAQKGVDKEFLGAISGSLEKLGTKPNGVTRSGRLDLRFLIANAMQAFTAQPLANQTQDNPFSNPLLLATLIIPHLETYMAAHSATRFLLLEYPPEHLTTVLALQRLVGVDLLRVAGILHSGDTESKPYPGFKVPPRTTTHLHTHSGPRSSILRTSPRTNATLLTSTGGAARQGETPSFAKANYLLTSSANESEIATLISTIWKILIDVSSFYIPEGTAPRMSTHSRTSSRDHHHHHHPYKRESNPSPNPNAHSHSHSQSRLLAQNPLINPAQQSAALSSASALMGFDKQASRNDASAAEGHQHGGNERPLYSESNPPPPPPKHKRREQSPAPAAPKSSRGSVAGTIRASRTVRSQRNKLRAVLGRDGGGDKDGDGGKTSVRFSTSKSISPSRSPSQSQSQYQYIYNKSDEKYEYGYGYDDIWCDEEEEDEDEDLGFAAEARKYMPLYGRRGGPRKGSSRKALKWLGLA